MALVLIGKMVFRQSPGEVHLPAVGIDNPLLLFNDELSLAAGSNGGRFRNTIAAGDFKHLLRRVGHVNRPERFRRMDVCLCPRQEFGKTLQRRFVLLQFDGSHRTDALAGKPFLFDLSQYLVGNAFGSVLLASYAEIQAWRTILDIWRVDVGIAMRRNEDSQFERG